MQTDPEAAIPAHLRTERTCPASSRDGWTPPYPSYVARFDESLRGIGMLIIGVQLPQRDTTSETIQVVRETMRLYLKSTEVYRHFDEVVFSDAAGLRNYAFIAYCTDHNCLDQSMRQLSDLWLSAEHGKTGWGFFIEQLWPSMDRVETLYSSNHVQGVGHLADELSGEVLEHGYWGSARDRMPRAQDDELKGAVGTVEWVEEGRRARVTGFHNLCLIRSGQDWAATEGDERQMYLNRVEPVLAEGMEFLTDQGPDIGCIENRYAQVLGDNDELTAQTFGLSWWNSMADLDAWAKDHPTHKSIFGVAMQYLGQHGESGNLKLTHEVMVLDRGQYQFDYLNCHAQTGLLSI